jgi:hypothetical protein
MQIMNLRSIGKDRHLKGTHERRLNMQNLQNWYFHFNSWNMIIYFYILISGCL